VPPWHPWAKLIIQDGVQDGCQNIISVMFQLLLFNINPRDMICSFKHMLLELGIPLMIFGASKNQNGRHIQDGCRSHH